MPTAHPSRTITLVPAYALLPGDHTVGPAVFADRGTIARVEPLPSGLVRVHYAGATHVDRDPEYLFDVNGLVARRGAAAWMRA